MLGGLEKAVPEIRTGRSCCGQLKALVEIRAERMDCQELGYFESETRTPGEKNVRSGLCSRVKKTSKERVGNEGAHDPTGDQNIRWPRR